MHTIAIYRGISLACSELVAEVESSMAPRIGETITLPHDGGPISHKVAEVNHQFDKDKIRIRVRVGP